MEDKNTANHKGIKLSTLWDQLVKSWLWCSILAPFFITRLIWLVVGLFSVNFVPNPTYADYAERGWFLSPHFFLDLFSRWDAKWYLSIVETGYQASETITETISNIAFFPLYPYLIKFVAWFTPKFLLSRSVYLLIGLIISNLSFLIAAILLYRWVRDMYGNEVAHRTNLLIFVFPTSFIFSAFYTESLFLLLSIMTLTSALRKKWLLASIFCSLLSITRVQGILIVIPLLIVYLQSFDYHVRKIKWEILGFGLPVLTLGSYLFLLSFQTSNILAPYQVQKAWGRLPGGYIERLWHEIGASVLDVFKFDALFLIIFLISSVMMFIQWRNKSLGIFSFVIVLIPIMSGSVISISRYVLTAFPVFIFWAKMLNNRMAFDAVRASLFALQILYFLGWANYYWVA